MVSLGSWLGNTLVNSVASLMVVVSVLTLTWFMINNRCMSSYISLLERVVALILAKCFLHRLEFLGAAVLTVGSVWSLEGRSPGANQSHPQR